jgi:hypothetical protein
MWPRLRLFLSVDLVGSTPIKQTNKGANHKYTDEDWSRRHVPPWHSPIADFYRLFADLFHAVWLQEVDECRKYLRGDFDPGSAPELWKTNGDELIFIKELGDSRQSLVAVRAWHASLRRYRSEIHQTGDGRTRDKPMPDIKGTVWLAGFPKNNSEVVLPAKFNGEPSVPPDTDQAVLAQLKRNDLWYRDETSRGELVRDFIGPSIDTGFRLTGLATPRKMIISIDAAWLVATAIKNLPDGKDDRIEFYYEGSAPLKGVLNGQPYPILSIGVDRRAFDAEEEKIQGRVHHLSSVQTVKLARAYIEDVGGFLIKPFVFNDPGDKTIPSMPDHYIGELKKWGKHWEAEEQLSKTESSATSDPQFGEATLDDSKKNDLVSRAAEAKGAASEGQPKP